MLMMVLEDGDTFTRLEGCKIVEINEAVEGDIDTAVEEVYDGETDDGRILAVFHERDGAPVVEHRGDLRVFGRDLTGGRELTGEERALIAEGLNYTEENGSPGMVPAMRRHTMRHAALAESITRKLGL